MGLVNLFFGYKDTVFFDICKTSRIFLKENRLSGDAQAVKKEV